jgi:hypothetical protein
MRLRWLILFGAIGMIVAWHHADLGAAYITVVGCLILRGLRIVQLRLKPETAGGVTVQPRPVAAAASTLESRTQLLILRRQKLAEKLRAATLAQERGQLQFELTVLDEALCKALGFDSPRKQDASHLHPKRERVIKRQASL